MRTLLNQIKKDDRLLHSTALGAWKAITDRALQSPRSSVSLVKALTSNNGTADRENFTKAKTLEQILLSADDDSLRRIVRYLHSLVVRPETSDQTVADHRRKNIADLLLKLVRQYKHYENLMPNALGKDSWLWKTLDLIVEFAYFTPSKSAKTRKVPLPPLSDSSGKGFQDCLSSCLTRLLNVEDGRTSFGLVVIGMIRAKATSPKTWEPRFNADESVMQTVEKALHALDRLSSQVHDVMTCYDILVLTHSLQEFDFGLDVGCPRVHTSIHLCTTSSLRWQSRRCLDARGFGVLENNAQPSERISIESSGWFH